MKNVHYDKGSCEHWQYGVIPKNFASFSKFTASIKFPEAATKVVPRNPWVCFSQEFGVSDLPAAGGLGYLAGDWIMLAGKEGIPFCGVGLYYRTRWRQDLDKNFMQIEHTHYTPHPSHYKFCKLTKKGENLTFPVYTNDYATSIEVFIKNIRGNPLIMLYEPGIKGLYEGQSYDEHRLYQSVVLGFGGIYVLSHLELEPSILHLNESSTVIAAIAYIDRLCLYGLTLVQALEKVKEVTLFTNHTLSPAAEHAWGKDQLRRYVGKNLKCDIVKKWFGDFVDSFKVGVCFSDFAFLLSGKINAVSQIHAKEAGLAFQRSFESVTNGISFRWVNSEIRAQYDYCKILDKITVLPSQDYTAKLELLSSERMVKIKKKAKKTLRRELKKGWFNQYNHPVDIPKEAKIAVWARRFDSYKRPGLLFEDVSVLGGILKKFDIHLIIAGRTHPTDTEMKKRLSQILVIVDKNPVLKKRVHFVKNYGWRIARFLVTGADIWINTPVVGTEACGTSWEKAVLNWVLLCSTPDGGVADVDSTSYLLIKGENDKEASRSLYSNLEMAGTILSDSKKWHEAVIRQLQTFLPVTNGPRMMGEYLDFALGK